MTLALKNMFSFFMCMSVVRMRVACTTSVSGALRDEKVSDSWKLEWRMPVGSGLIQVFWKDSRCCWPVSHLPTPFLELFSSSMSTVCLSVLLYLAVFCITPMSFTCYVLPCFFFFWFYHFPLIEYFSSRIVFALSCIILCHFVSLIKTYQLAFCWADVVFYLFISKLFLKIILPRS